MSEMTYLVKPWQKVTLLKIFKLLLLYATYHPPFQNDNYFFDNIVKGLHVYFTYVRDALTVSFNTQVGENYLTPFDFITNSLPLVTNPRVTKTQTTLAA